MPINTTLAGLSQTPSSNGPDGTVDAPSTIDDAIRNALSFTAMLRDNVGFTAGAKAALGNNTDITSLGNNTSTMYVTAGSSTAYTISPGPGIAAYTAGQSFFVQFNAASGASPTISINGIATPPSLIKQNSDGTYSAIAAGDIPINHRSKVTLINGIQALVERLPPSAALVIPGTIIDWAGNAAPAGYLACPIVATNISRTTYAALFANIGTTWGAGDGSTTFGMPYFPNGYTALHGPTTGAGQTTVGLIQDHTHPIAAPNGATSVGGAVQGHTGVTGQIQSVTGNNFAAGMYVLKCVKF